MDLQSGANDAWTLAPDEYFAQGAPSVMRDEASVTGVIAAR